MCRCARLKAAARVSVRPARRRLSHGYATAGPRFGHDVARAPRVSLGNALEPLHEFGNRRAVSRLIAGQTCWKTMPVPLPNGCAREERPGCSLHRFGPLLFSLVDVPELKGDYVLDRPSDDLRLVPSPDQ